ncbi:aminoglycoside phosphotransferase family protein [Kineococcus endophyticus]|uniref:Aminoglycoside phosphotransferase family protein n=1 Tax=Kineococcus endophyticus TaxID=1181883 RepID=A0ABV3PBF2_9ACTN
MPGRLSPTADRVVAARAARADGGGAWLRDLPHRVDDLVHPWRLRLGEPLAGGTAAVVHAVTRDDGTPAVLKLPVPDPGNALSTRTLLAADGDGLVRVLAHDGDDLLLERLGPSLTTTGRTPQAQLAVLAQLLPRVWRLPPDGATVDKAAELTTFLLDLVGAGPVDYVTAMALQFAARRSRAFAPERSRTLHGDAAAANVLLAPARPAGAAFVDPDGLVGDAAYDVGVALRDWSAELLADARPAGLLRGWCAEAAARTGTDPQAVWEWAFLERVSTGTYARTLGAEDLADALLESARRLLPEI